jgi:uncharacterized membrane protein
VSVAGLEPATNSLKGYCSAIELHAHIAKCILSRGWINVNLKALYHLVLRYNLILPLGPLSASPRGKISCYMPEEIMLRKFSLACVLILPLLALLLPAPALAAQNNTGVVKAVMFWVNGCPYCEQVLLDVLPPLQEQYGDQLQVTLVELVDLQDINRLYKLGAAFGLEKEQVNLPFLVLDNTALVGAEQIPEQLPALIEQHLAAGGVDFPDLPGLVDMLPSGILFTAFDPSQFTETTAEGTASSGMWLAWITLAGLIATLVVAVVAILRAFQGHPLPEPKGWLEWALPILSLIGLGVALYLTYVEATAAKAICGPVGDCNAVQSSSYARLFGVLPVGLLGAFGYVGILVVWLYRRFRKDALAEMAGPALFGMTAFGVLFSIYLTYLEIFVIHAVCIWCISSALIMLLLMLLTLGALTQWLAVSDEED